MSWRMAKSVDVLLAELNTLAPHRSKASDGGIGNAEHASRSSDHNPHIIDGGIGVVSARDFTHDPASGVDSQKLAEQLVASRDSRIKYIISNRKIASGSDGPSPWIWRNYTGANPHNHHFHLSVKPQKAAYDDTRPWGITLGPVSANAPASPATPVTPMLRVGAKGKDVERLQTLLNQHGEKLKVDGDFGMATKAALMRVQTKLKLVADGIVGTYTWEKLNG